MFIFAWYLLGYAVMKTAHMFANLLVYLRTSQLLESCWYWFLCTDLLKHMHTYCRHGLSLGTTIFFIPTASRCLVFTSATHLTSWHICTVSGITYESNASYTGGHDFLVSCHADKAQLPLNCEVFV